MSWVNTLLRNVAVGLGFIRRPDLISQLVSDHPAPEVMQSGVLYIVGGAKFQKWAMFRCPRYEDEIIQLSLMASRRPSWTVTIDFMGRPTIHPSIRQTSGSYAHFWLKKGYVNWCADSGHHSHNSHV